jgi:ubiquinone/menaquinone biosynthesis C-methylase UbiE
MADATDIDFGRRSDDYVAYRPGLPDSFYDRLEQFVTLDGATALDLGTGPGHTALVLARRGVNVTGIDISENQIEAARRRASELQLDVQFVVGRAEETGLADSSLDLVTASQCWGWFDHAAALAEVERMLRPGGLLIVAHYCYLPTHSDIARRSEELVLKYNPTWTMAGWTGVYHKHIEQMQRGSMSLVEQFCYDHVEPFTHEGWRGRIRTCNGVGSGIMSDDQVADFDTELAELLRREFPREPLLVEHRVWATIVRKPGEGSA